MSNPIRAYREKNNLTQRQMAERLGVSRATVGHIESGIRKITAENARDWSDLLGIGRDELCPEIFGARSPTPQPAEAAHG